MFTAAFTTILLYLCLPRHCAKIFIESPYFGIIYIIFVGLRALGVTFSPRDTRFLNSNLAEDVKILSTSPLVRVLSRGSRNWDFRLFKGTKALKIGLSCYFCIVLFWWGGHFCPIYCDLFKIYCAPPNLGITRTWICRLNFAQRPIFFRLEVL